jgi:hypothetical protein
MPETVRFRDRLNVEWNQQVADVSKCHCEWSRGFFSSLLDVSEQFNSRLEKLLETVDADTKASLIRQALQVYEHIAQQTVSGYSFKIVKNGEEKDLVFLGPAVSSSSDESV